MEQRHVAVFEAANLFINGPRLTAGAEVPFDTYGTRTTMAFDIATRGRGSRG